MDLGDGTTSTEESPTNSYAQGDYTISLKAFSKKDKKSSESEQTINVGKNAWEIKRGELETQLLGVWTADSITLKMIQNLLMFKSN